MLIDTHVHTYYCKHATGQPADYVAEARRRGLDGICFTDHIPAPDGYDSENRMELEEYPSYTSLISSVREESGDIVVGVGLEADYYKGCEAFLRDWLPRQELDLVLGSVHVIKGWPFDDALERGSLGTADIVEIWRDYFGQMARLADLRLFDVVAHLDLPKKFVPCPRDRDLREIAQPALDRIAAAGMGVELNTSGLRRSVREIYPSPLLLRLCRDRGIPICFGSDAHAPEEVGYAFDEAVIFARSVGYSSALRFRRRQPTSVPLP